MTLVNRLALLDIIPYPVLYIRAVGKVHGHFDLQLYFTVGCYHVFTDGVDLPLVRHRLVCVLHVVPIRPRPYRSFLIRVTVENAVHIFLADAVAMARFKSNIDEIASLIIYYVVICNQLVTISALNHLEEPAARFLGELIDCNANLACLEEVHFGDLGLFLKNYFVEIVLAVEHSGLESTREMVEKRRLHQVVFFVGNEGCPAPKRRRHFLVTSKKSKILLEYVFVKVINHNILLELVW